MTWQALGEQSGKVQLLAWPTAPHTAAACARRVRGDACRLLTGWHPCPHAAGMYYSHRRVGQPGGFTRIMCCTKEEYEKLSEAERTIVPTHWAPSYTVHPRTGAGRGRVGGRSAAEKRVASCAPVRAAARPFLLFGSWRTMLVAPHSLPLQHNWPAPPLTALPRFFCLQVTCTTRTTSPWRCTTGCREPMLRRTTCWLSMRT